MNATLKPSSVATELVGFAAVLGRNGESSVQATNDVAQTKIETSRNREANEILVAPRRRILQAFLITEGLAFHLGRLLSWGVSKKGEENLATQFFERATEASQSRRFEGRSAVIDRR